MAEAIEALWVVIATSQRTQLLERTLSSLAEAEKPSSFRGLVVIENGEDGSSKEIVLRFKDSLGADYRFHPVGNKSAALNVGLQSLPESLVVFTDDDVRFERKALVAYYESAAQHGKGHYFGGPLEVDYEQQPPDWLISHLPASARGWSYFSEGMNGEAPLFLGANWAAYTSDLKAVGMFDPSMGPGADTGAVGQETSMQLRLRDAGIRPVYVSDAKVWHYVPAERCCPKWALERAYRHSLSFGMLHQAPRPSVAGLPLGGLKNLVFRGIGMLPASFSRNSEKRFCAKCQFVSALGYLRGRRLLWKKQNSSYFEVSRRKAKGITEMGERQTESRADFERIENEG